MNNQISNTNQVPSVNEPKNQVSSQVAVSPKTISADEVRNESFQLDKKNQEEEKKRLKELKKSLKKPKEKKKSDYVNILLVLTICLLLIVIIAPPVLRKLMPKQVISENEKNKNAIILICTGINQTEQYKITSRTKYIDGKIKQNIITYTKLTDAELVAEANSNPQIAINPSSEISFFQTVSGISIDNNGKTITVSIHDYTAERNTSNFRFMNYFQELEYQKSFYGSQGYKCQEIKN